MTRLPHSHRPGWASMPVRPSPPVSSACRLLSIESVFLLFSSDTNIETCQCADSVNGLATPGFPKSPRS